MARIGAVLTSLLLTAGGGTVDSERIRTADDEPGGWLAHGRTYSEQRFSPLDQIHAANVRELGLAWSYLPGTRRGMEATPLVVDGVLYATGPWSVVFALDARTGSERWRYDPRVARETGRKACCDVVNRGVAVWKDRVYVGVLDGRLVALDARTGRVVWQVQTVDADRPYTITGAPRVLKDRVVIGNGGAEFGVRGYVSAYDAATGELLWRFYTVPAHPSQPREHPELEWAAATWPADALWEAGGGGTVWDSMAYDAELDLLYVGTGNSSVYNRAIRSPGGGDNLFLASILALDPDTGRLVWHYQTTPAESWDYTATQHMILADLELGGATRRVLLQAPKNGFFYVLDRASGELISAEPYVPVSWASHVDLATGRPVETGDADWTDDARFVTPGPSGGHNWQPMAFSPLTGLVYIPTLTTPYPFFPDPDFAYAPGRMNTGEDFPALDAFASSLPTLRICSPSHLTAWDPVQQRRSWRVEHDDPVNGGLLATAGNLVFQGTGSGRLVAYAADTGAVLWESDAGVGIMAPPISYAIEGEQYIAVLAGVGGSVGMSFAHLSQQNEGRVLAYKLGGSAALPPVPPLQERRPDPPPATAPPEAVEQGRRLYAVHCLRCHGAGARSSGLVPDLRLSSRAVHDAWASIVLEGALRDRGMAGFADLLGPDESAAVHAYVIERAHARTGLAERAFEWIGERVCIPSWLLLLAPGLGGP